MSSPVLSQQALNKAMLEAVDFIHAEGWDAGPTLFALVPTELLADQLDPDQANSPLTLVVQDTLPAGILPGSAELDEYITRLAWPSDVAGVILAQEISFRDASAPEGDVARHARLFSGVLRSDGIDLTLLQLRPTEAELESNGPFAEDNIELRGGPNVAPHVTEALRFGLEQDPDEL
ncbi:hypothetical protein CAPI_02460 [Corynebacterium capitovis DSM 44611]|uniref:PPA1309 family protein n=1 Tax=Corynebacterium capitovis TaxID=131081 RepID=UPI000477EC44|nr:PPA1309 family protein [Corynebacterium capitovis]WKD57066.1 hypothetical protein CAPI_02460 [Corynebacterium capitovis DSM 44611]